MPLPPEYACTLHLQAFQLFALTAARWLRSGESRRRWLAFNLLGCISSRVEEGQSVVEVAFHDATSHKRVPLFSDFRDFCMASLGPKVWPASYMLGFCRCACASVP